LQKHRFARLVFPTTAEIFPFHISTAFFLRNFGDFSGMAQVLPNISPTFQHGFPHNAENLLQRGDEIRTFRSAPLSHFGVMCNDCNQLQKSTGKTAVFVFHKLWKTWWKDRENCGNTEIIRKERHKKRHGEPCLFRIFVVRLSSL
jgi:hypothetical protein